MLSTQLPPDWQLELSAEFEKPYFKQLTDFVRTERQSYQVFPPEADVFNAFHLTPFDKVRVLILGQDPYHDDNQAHGLCFSVRDGISPPPSLMNIYKELQTDVGFKIPKHGNLTSWATQGILMLNSVLTVRAHTPNSHKNKGWETFTDVVIRKVNDKKTPIIFVLWGNYAQKKATLIDGSRHRIIESAHPSPLSARNGFFGSKPFSKIKSIDWQV
jgi:uracil-DNA glycosylase